MADKLHLEFFGGVVFGERVYEALLYVPPASFDTKILVLARRLSHADAQALALRFQTEFDAKWHSPKVYQIPLQ